MCEQAIELGREHRADFKLLGKAYARIAAAHERAGRLEEACKYYGKSLAESRTPDVREKLSKLEKQIEEQRQKAYIDPQKAEEEKNIGNELFRKGEFSEALKHYTEAIRRNPDDARNYSNRAACYTKLMAFREGISDCDACIRLDPKFVKGYTRKGTILYLLKEYHRALEAYEKAIELDPDNAEAKDGLDRTYEAINRLQMEETSEEAQARALQNPEVQEILRDKAMQVVLSQMTSDPAAAAKYAARRGRARAVRLLTRVPVQPHAQPRGGAQGAQAHCRRRAEGEVALRAPPLYTITVDGADRARRARRYGRRRGASCLMRTRSAGRPRAPSAAGEWDRARQ